ncbi:MAG: HNH endonuclease [Polyangiaceae bacterium]|nr:HNH endonuclease [Polyangiaceae bacterium]
MTSLSGCAVEVTEWRLKAQSQAKYTYVCRRTPDVPEGVQYWAVKTETNETVTDREPERLIEFAKDADWIYEFHPHAPASTVDHFVFPYNHLTCNSDMWVTVPPRKALPKNEIDVSYAFRQAMAEVLADGCALPPPETASMQGVREHMGQLLTTPRPIVIDPETGKPRDFISPLQKTILRELSIRVLFEGGAVREKDLPKDADGKPYKWWRDPKIVAQPNVQRVGGFVSGVAVGVAPGGAMGSDVLIETRMLPQGTRDARIGKALGEIVVGGGQFFVGIGGVVAGTGMSATGGGAAPGALICLGSITLVANGGATFCHGAEQLTLELLFKRDDTQATVIPIAPPKPAAKPNASKPKPKPKPLPIAKPAPKPTPTKTTTRVRGASEPTTTTTTSASGTRTTTRPRQPTPNPVKARKPHQPDPDKWTKKGGTIKEHPDGRTTYRRKDGVEVTYDKHGYPDFAPYRHPTVKDVKIEFTGKYDPDFAAANAAAGLKRTPDGYTWHHHQDGRTMQLIKQEIHREFFHTGGMATTR